LQLNSSSVMQSQDTLLVSPLTGSDGRERLLGRIKDLGREVARAEVRRIAEILGDEERTLDEVRDAVSTRLMEAFKGERARGPFGLLYELNASHLVIQVAARLRRYSSQADPLDVLQEVFFNVYRYPHRFDSTRDDAFRVWSAMIVRNTVLKHLRSQGRGGRQEIPFEDLSDQPTDGQLTPVQGAIHAEDREKCAEVYVTYLTLYMTFYQMLGEREQRALTLVEVDGASYRDAAADLGIRLENLKMVIFRARRKIHRAMRRTFDGLPHDCRPAREPSEEARLSPNGCDVEFGDINHKATESSNTEQNHIEESSQEDKS
jgi:RNA polymerase sigma-70 factor (ECF subfamily)